MDTHMILMGILIAFSRICDVTLMSIRTILLTKGMSKIAACLGFFEVLIYIKVLGNVVSSLDNKYYLICYCLGFASGVFIGSRIESALAFGDAQMRIITSKDNEFIVDDLRAMGFGVTTFSGQGRDDERLMLFTNLKRKNIKKVYEYLKQKDVNAVVSTNDVSSVQNGYESLNSKRVKFYDFLKK